ncbi:hypothetical protein EDB89DRAFT_2069517 [Lactarius sanguifluus]|nr:hypothetical protein EDB89DRAFT_2069517 [Lactarius sanguifluus]
MRIRVQQYLAFAARLRANVLAPDYRGFADSAGTPSEAGVVLDTHAAWDWLRAALEEEADARDKKTKSGVAGWVHRAPAAVRERPRGVCSSPRSAN